jgi:2-polyprenyl-3-methyl-5-hydroxy-6-metoxy-1,4-benzoquinol methylase
MDGLNNSKYEDSIKFETTNLIAKLLLKGFFNELQELLDTIDFNNVYEAGCGNGYITEFLRNKYPYAKLRTMDIDEDKISVAKTRVEGVAFTVGNIPLETRLRKIPLGAQYYIVTEG